MVTRVLDIGAQGIIAPHVRTAEDAQRLRDFATYPPAGLRGLGTGRASRRGLTPAVEYLAAVQQEVFLGAMIEDREVVGHLPGILEAGLDLLLFGPADMSASLGVPGDVTHPQLLDIKQSALDAARGTATAVGIAVPNEQTGTETLDQGFRFVALGPAEVLLGRQIHQLVNTIKASPS